MNETSTRKSPTNANELYISMNRKPKTVVFIAGRVSMLESDSANTADTPVTLPFANHLKEAKLLFNE